MYGPTPVSRMPRSAAGCHRRSACVRGDAQQRGAWRRVRQALAPAPSRGWRRTRPAHEQRSLRVRILPTPRYPARLHVPAAAGNLTERSPRHLASCAPSGSRPRTARADPDRRHLHRPSKGTAKDPIIRLRAGFKGPPARKVRRKRIARLQARGRRHRVGADHRPCSPIRHAPRRQHTGGHATNRMEAARPPLTGACRDARPRQGPPDAEPGVTRDAAGSGVRHHGGWVLACHRQDERRAEIVRRPRTHADHDCARRGWGQRPARSTGAHAARYKPRSFADGHVDGVRNASGSPRCTDTTGRASRRARARQPYHPAGTLISTGTSTGQKKTGA